MNGRQGLPAPCSGFACHFPSNACTLQRCRPCTDIHPGRLLLVLCQVLRRGDGGDPPASRHRVTAHEAQEPFLPSCSRCIPVSSPVPLSAFLACHRAGCDGPVPCLARQPPFHPFCSSLLALSQLLYSSTLQFSPHLTVRLMQCLRVLGPGRCGTRTSMPAHCTMCVSRALPASRWEAWCGRMSHVAGTRTPIDLALILS